VASVVDVRDEGVLIFTYNRDSETATGDSQRWNLPAAKSASQSTAAC
jgi:hypothetical protein